MNYYVLYCQTVKTEKVCFKLNRNKQLHAFIPKMEKYIGSKGLVDLQVMFPGYLFVKTDLSQQEFSLFISTNDDKDGIIKELKKNDVSALTDEEIDIFTHLLDDDAILKMSRGYKENGKTVVTEGPLIYFQDKIVAVNKKDMLAILNIEFLKRKIKAGMWLK